MESIPINISHINSLEFIINSAEISLYLPKKILEQTHIQYGDLVWLQNNKNEKIPVYIFPTSLTYPLFSSTLASIWLPHLYSHQPLYTFDNALDTNESFCDYQILLPKLKIEEIPIATEVILQVDPKFCKLQNLPNSLINTLLDKTIVSIYSLVFIDWMSNITCKVQDFKCKSQYDNSIFLNGKITRSITRVTFITNSHPISSTIPYSTLSLSSYLPSETKWSQQISTELGGIPKIGSKIIDSFKNMPFKPIILYGLSGTGKKTLINSILKFSTLPFFTLQHHDILDQSLDICIQKLTDFFDCAFFSSPSIVFIPSLESYISNDNTSNLNHIIGSFLKFVLDNFHKTFSPPYLLISSSDSVTSIPSFIRSYFIEYEMSLPTYQNRCDILSRFFHSFHFHISPSLEISSLVSFFSKKTTGWLPVDLFNFFHQIILFNHSFESNKYDSMYSLLSTKKLTLADFQTVFEQISPSILNTDSIDCSSQQLLISAPSLDNLGGLEIPIQTLLHLLSSPSSNNSNIPLGITPIKGILISGPSGVGKTSLALAICKYASISLSHHIIVLKSTEIISKVVGQSEKKLFNIFYKAKTCTPSILLIDQIEMLAGSNQSIDSDNDSCSGSSSRLLSSLLLNIDNLHGYDVTLIATTSVPYLLDSSILQYHRLAHHLSLKLPNYDQRKAILNVLLNNLPYSLSSDKIDSLCKLMVNYSGADIQHLLREAIFLIMENQKNIPFFDILCNIAIKNPKRLNSHQ